MITYKEAVYLVLDELKLNNDDTVWEPSHIIAILDKYRALLIKQRYSHIRGELPRSFYQPLEIFLDPTIPCYHIPRLIDLNGIEMDVTIISENKEVISLIPYERFQYIGANKWLANQVFASLDYNNDLLVKAPVNFKPCKADLYAVLETPLDLISFNSLPNTDRLAYLFPIEQAMYPDIISLTVKELSASIYLPNDTLNNANDNLNNINTNGRTK